MTASHHRELGSFTCSISGNGAYTTVVYADWFFKNEEADLLMTCLIGKEDQQTDCNDHHMLDDDHHDETP